MTYPKSSFFTNLEAATKFKDDDMIMDLFADQITDIALKHPDALHAALDNAGVKVEAENKDPKYLVSNVADNWSNKKLLQNVSLIISDINTPSAAAHHNADAAKVDDSIVQGAAIITQSAMQPKIDTEVTKGKMNDYLSAKSEAAKEVVAKVDTSAKATAGAANSKGKGTMIAGCVGLAIVAIIGLGVFAYKQSKT